MKVKKWLACIMALAIAAATAACGGDNGLGASMESSTDEPSSSVSAGEAAEGDGPLTPYPETITMSFGLDLDINSAEAAKLAEAGEPYDNNRWTKLYEDELNIKTEYELLAPGEQYNQQIKLLMSSNELPDYFKINDWADFQQMADAGLLADMTDIYEKYASPLLRSIIEKETDKIFLPVTYEGRKYGIPRVFPSTNGYSHLWIRQDWLDNLKLEVPRTMDDLMNIAKAFKEQDPDGNGQDDTLGMRLDKTYMDQKGLFWAFGGYPNFWLTKEDGSIDFGTVQPEIKEGLQFIKTMLDDGLVNPEFATTDRETSKEEIVSGKSGMYYGPHWETPKDSMEADENAVWIETPLPTKDGGEIKIPLTLGGQDGAIVATANAEHPEAIVKMMNAYVEALFGETGDFNYYFTMEGVAPIWSYSPVTLLDPEIDVDGYRQWAAAEKTGDYAGMVGSGKGFYEFTQEGLYEYELMFGPKNSCFAYVDQTYPDQILENAYFGAPTETQAARGSSMSEYLNTTLAALVTGQQDMDTGFDAMVKEWRSMGGDQVIVEIQEALDAYESGSK